MFRKGFSPKQPFSHFQCFNKRVKNQLIFSTYQPEASGFNIIYTTFNMTKELYKVESGALDTETKQNKKKDRLIYKVCNNEPKAINSLLF